MDTTEILKNAAEERKAEISGYQINIDNYERAIAKINEEYANTPGMLEFREQLIELLASHKTEQLKAIIIRDVILDQLKEREAS